MNLQYLVTENETKREHIVISYLSCLKRLKPHQDSEITHCSSTQTSLWLRLPYDSRLRSDAPQAGVSNASDSWIQDYDRLLADYDGLLTDSVPILWYGCIPWPKGLLQLTQSRYINLIRIPWRSWLRWLSSRGACCKPFHLLGHQGGVVQGS